MCHENPIARTNLESINVSQSVLHVAVHHQLAETQHLSAQMEGIAESGLLTFLWDTNIRTNWSVNTATVGCFLFEIVKTKMGD